MKKKQVSVEKSPSRRVEGGGREEGEEGDVDFSVLCFILVGRPWARVCADPIAAKCICIVYHQFLFQRNTSYVHSRVIGPCQVHWISSQIFFFATVVCMQDRTAQR